MEFTFKNIDTCKKLYHEVLGDIQPKFWFKNPMGDILLVKRQHSQKVTGRSEKSRMFNHFGEYFGYNLNKKAKIATCPVDIVTLHDTKNKYSTTKKLYTACASYNLRKNGEEIYPGEFIISKFMMRNPSRYKEILNSEDKNISNLTRGNISINNEDDNVDIVLAAIVSETKAFEKKKGERTESQIKRDIDNNLTNAIEMIVSDCIFGNSDRHSQNWAMIYNDYLGTVEMYPNYDNEAVLGLRKTEAEIKRVVSDKDNLTDYSKKEMFSRMGFSPINSGVSYENMLEHLVNKYPTYAIPAIKKITDLVSEKYVEELYDAAKGITERSQDSAELTKQDELPEEYKTFGVRLYSERREYAKDLVRKFEEKQKTLQSDRADKMLVL